MGIFFGKILRGLFGFLDKAVYQCIIWLYQLFMDISFTGVFTSDDIQSLASRLYFFLGLIMVFKVSISIISYIMNPDSLKDSKVGAGKLLKNIIIILVGIVLVPYIFEAAYGLQKIVLKEDVIGTLILGTNHNENANVDTAGKNMAFTTYTAFFHLSEDYFTEECYTNPFIDGEIIEFNEKCKYDKEGNESKMYSALESIKIPYGNAYKANDPIKLTDFDLLGATVTDDNKKETFLFDYTVLVTTLAGGFLAYILLIFCFDIAVRSVKLGFLQLVAPIPLISKIDPKKGEEVFNKWVKECISTYVSLFIRLVAIYFAIYLISILDGIYIITDEGVRQNNLLVKVFIIFGTLLFVKDLPKLVESLTGIKLGTDGLSLRKKVASTPLIGGATVAAAGLAGRTAGHLARGTGNILKNNALAKSIGEDFKDTGNKLKGTKPISWISSKLSTVGTAGKNLGNKFNDLTGGEFGEIGRDASAVGHGIASAGKQSFGALDRQMDRLEMRKGQLMRQTQEANKKIASKKSVADAIKKMEDRAWDQISTGQAKTIKGKNGQEYNLSDHYRQLSASLESAKTSGNASAIADAQKAMDNFKQTAINTYMNSVKGDLTFDNLYNEYVKQCSISGEATIERVAYDFTKNYDDYCSDVAGNIHSQYGNLKGTISQINQDEIMVANDEISGIDSEIKQIQEDIKSGKPYLPFGNRK